MEKIELLSVRSSELVDTKTKCLLWYFIFVFYLLPLIEASGLSIVLNRIYFNLMGYNLLAFILLLPLIRKTKSSFFSLFRLSLNILLLYLIFQFWRTSLITSTWQTLTVFRYAYMQCINFILVIPFILQLRKNEIDYIVDNLLRCTIVLCFIYLSNILVYDWMGVKGIRNSVETQGGVSVFRSIIGYPLLDPFWMSLLIPLSILGYRKSSKIVLLFFFTLFMSYTRNQLFSCIVIFLVVIFFMMLKGVRQFGKIIKFIFIVCFGFIIINLIFPDSFSFWIGKLESTFSNDLVDNTGTFDYRKRLIEFAIESINDSPLIGIGYINEAAYGEASMVLGGDTYIAPILYCEGYIGLVLRVLPFIILLFYCLRKYFSSNYISVIDIAFISGFVGSCVNYVQTKSLTHYAIILGLYFIYKRKQFLDELEENNYE